MSTRQRHASLVVVVAVLALSAFGAALAWACTPKSYIDFSATSGHPGDTVAVTGKGFVSGPVEIHWNGATGPVLATAAGPDFTVKITIPQVAPGVYYPHGVARDADGQITGDAPRAFQVQGTAAPATASTPAPDRSPGPVTATAPGSRPLSPAVPTHRTAAGGRNRAPANGRDRTAANGGGQRPYLVSRTHHPAATIANPATGAPVPAPAIPTSAVTKEKSGVTVFSDSVGGAGRESDPRSLRRAPAQAWHLSAGWHPHLVRGDGAAPQPARSTVDQALALGRRTSPASQEVGRQAGPPLAIGAGLLGVGLVLLFGGFAVAQVRTRRRVLADARHGRTG